MQKLQAVIFFDPESNLRWMKSPNMTHDKKWLSLAIGLTFLTLDLVTQPSLSQGGLHFLILSFSILSQDHFQPVLSFFILNQNDMSFCHHAPVFSSSAWMFLSPVISGHVMVHFGWGIAVLMRKEVGYGQLESITIQFFVIQLSHPIISKKQNGKTWQLLNWAVSHCHRHMVVKQSEGAGTYCLICLLQGVWSLQWKKPKMLETPWFYAPRFKGRARVWTCLN